MQQRQRVAILSLLAVPVVLAGCVERTITITSEPPGAIVWLNDVEIGRTPVETDFTFYGVYDVRLRLDGYESVIASREAKSPVFDLPAIDLLAEAAPTKFRSNIAWHFDLKPLPEAEPGADQRALEDQLVERARALREQVPAPSGEKK